MAPFTVSEIKAFFKKVGFAQFVIDFVKAVLGDNGKQDTAGIGKAIKEYAINEEVKPSIRAQLNYEKEHNMHVGITIAKAILSEDDEPVSKGDFNMFCWKNFGVPLPMNFDGYFESVLGKRARSVEEPKVEPTVVEPTVEEPTVEEPEAEEEPSAKKVRVCTDTEPEAEEEPRAKKVKVCTDTEPESEIPILSKIESSVFDSSDLPTSSVEVAETNADEVVIARETAIELEVGA